MRLSHGEMRETVLSIAFGRAKSHARWWESRNVVGICFAPKVRRGRLEDIALQVHVRRKRAHAKIPGPRRIPPTVTVSGVRVPTDVRELRTSRLEVLASAERPAHPGYDIGNRIAGIGTLGCVVRCRATQAFLALSCAHVVGRDGRARSGERVLVPSTSTARANDVLAEAPFGTLVSTGRLSFDFDDAGTNVDAATVRPDDPASLDSNIALLGVAPAGVRNAVDIGTRVRKVGAATELTHGGVQAIHWVISLPYVDENGDTRDVWFTEQIGITSFTAPGDSGSLVVDDDDRAIGLHVGSAEGLSVSTPIRHVLDAVGCDLVTR